MASCIVCFDHSVNECLLYFNGVSFNTLYFPTVENYTRNTCYVRKRLWPTDHHPTYFLDDFRLYDCTISHSNISYICRNTFCHKNTLVLSLFNSYVLSSTRASVTDFCMFKSGLNLCEVYAPDSSGSCVPSGFYSTVIFNPWTLTLCRNYMTMQ